MEAINAELHRSNQKVVVLGILTIAACVACVWMLPFFISLM